MNSRPRTPPSPQIQQRAGARYGRTLLRSVAFSLVALGCGDNQEAKAPSAPVTAPPPTATSVSPRLAAKLDRIKRADFNRVAAELALPVFWVDDKDKNNILEPAELAVYWGLDPKLTRAELVGADGAFTPRMLAIYDAIVKESSAKPDSDPRRAAVRKELAQGRVTLVATDLTNAAPYEKAFVASVLRASSLIEQLYAKQQATTALAAKVPADDPASKTLFWRSQGPKCEAPSTQDDPNCGALLAADMPKTKISGMYPAVPLASNPKFCEDLQKKYKSAKKSDFENAGLTDPFTVVGESDNKKESLIARPFHEAWPAETSAIAKELESAALALGEKEPALKAYLVAAAKAFTTDEWWPADEAWAKMDAKSSRFYLRIAPDEVYDEPCSTKALFHVSFGLINQGSVKWQQKLDPLKVEMENELATLAGAPYKARPVEFKIPDFVDIAINAGDSRKAFGATIGQSLPNFGPVANGDGKKIKPHGRTVAMTNFYTDPDSIEASEEQASSLFCKDTMAKWTNDQESQLMGTVLHEAAHNLGPAHQYKANGKVDREAFGGPLASTLEELKAQTAALHFTEWLINKKQISRDDADKAHVRDIFWAFGHISRGMYGENHHPKNYSQLAAIQLGVLMKEGAISWKDAEPAENGKDKGCFSIDLPKMPGAIKKLMTTVARIKAKGDKPGAEVLIKEYVDVTGDRKKLHDVITERITRAPKASFVYSVKLE